MTKRELRIDPSQKPDRKTVERNRRIQMKELCSRLSSIISSHHFKYSSKETMSRQNQLDYAASYISQLKERIEMLERIKQQALIPEGTGRDCIDMMNNEGLILPVFELKDLGSAIEVILITGLRKNFMLYEVISVLEQEGAEVISASFSTVGDKIFHSIHAQARISRLGVEIRRACQRLQELVS